ncbi:xylulokinase [Compostibacter hankyongensis]|uniref:FGGY-family carbohydrate kinase n=1 Tax=Compostibacter hankyongensis TaxID=1007089 RepID=A0ABP8G443_9BACT
MRYLLGYDIGSSSVKGALLDAATGRCLAAAFSPEEEMPILAPRPGWAEQDPEAWWKEVITVTDKLRNIHPFGPGDIVGIGLSYQMHGLVCLDREGRVLRPAIIWCDSRAVARGEAAVNALGRDFCLDRYLNAPGNFTASKLSWVKENEPAVFEKIYKVMLPGDYIACRMSGEMTTTVSGLSEGIWWDFREQRIASDICGFYGYPEDLLCPVVPAFGEQVRLNAAAAQALGIAAGTPVTYRAGDQPNNAYTLGVLSPGEAAATAGTSGVVYGVNDRIQSDPASRVNTFVHVNHTPEQVRNGVLLCVNGTGILYNWLKKNLAMDGYERMNELAATVEPGAGGLLFLPFGNGAERILENRDLGASLVGLNFNIHTRAHMLRAAQEGIVYALRFGLEIMLEMGVEVTRVKAGAANMFLSPVFRNIFASTTGAVIELFRTDGAQGAARAAGVGAGYYAGYRESYIGMESAGVVEPDPTKRDRYETAYRRWKQELEKTLTTSAEA